MNIKDIIKEHDFKIKKQYGQNFLNDQNVLNNIVNITNIANSNIIEIGPGLGSLTTLLESKAKKLICYEIDNEAIPILEDKFLNSNKITIIKNDFLKVDLKQDIYDYFNNEEVIVVANLPYYITTAIITKILEETKYVSTLIVMMQKEVALRFTGKPSTKDYNGLSVLIQYYMDAKITFNVSRKSFIPVPDVDSAVVLLTRKKTLEPILLNSEFFIKFNRAIFSQRRKTIMNSIKANFNYTSNQIEEIFKANNLSTTIRAEALTYKDIVLLANSFYKYSTN